MRIKNRLLLELNMKDNNFSQLIEWKREIDLSDKAVFIRIKISIQNKYEKETEILISKGKKIVLLYYLIFIRIKNRLLP